MREWLDWLAEDTVEFEGKGELKEWCVHYWRPGFHDEAGHVGRRSNLFIGPRREVDNSIPALGGSPTPIRRRICCPLPNQGYKRRKVNFVDSL